jgi:aspartyl-tRNA(Asn)/glutamyl-tRNA(Gln) amidotransferase subunit C
VITRDDVIQAAKLSRLALTEPEVAKLAGDLERIVAYVEQLQSVDVEGVEPMVQPFDLDTVRRADEPAPVIGRKALEGSKGYDDGLVRVPKVVD